MVQKSKKAKAESDDKAKSDDAPVEKPQAKSDTPKKTTPEKGKSLNFVKDTIESIVPKSEESQQISDDYKKQKADRVAMNAEEEAQLDNYLKSKGIEGGRADFPGWDKVEGGFSAWSDSEESTKAAELRDKLSETSDEFYELERKKNVQEFYDLTRGSEEELKARHKELDAEVERLQAEQRKQEDGDDGAQDATPHLYSVTKDTLFTQTNGESDREIYGDMKKDDNQMERIYKDQLKKRNESVSLKKESKSMKLMDLLNESQHLSYKRMNVGEEEDKERKMTKEEKRKFLKAVSEYKRFGESIYRSKIYEVHGSIKDIVETAHKVTLEETGDWFDRVTVNRHMKSMNESFKVFEKQSQK